ncbi:N-(5'-phosphoribosyl)anthranilate isomerase [Streptomyces sp. NPDC020490]|uniref:phosphoribosylanthranilate isomerase n=1 Tax=Streptomyces sp. NPDC020490 TaxID=3365078 RepID=UPI00378F2BA3
MSVPPPAGPPPAPRPLLKVCGATRSEEAAAVGARADLVGLWYGVEGGAHDLPDAAVPELADAVRAGGRAEPVLVTFLHDADRLARVARAARVRWLQLHAYQPPGAVAALRTALPDATLVKAVHVLDGRCVERPFLGAYARAGTDLFLVDAATPGGGVGSTGHRLPPGALEPLLPALGLPFLLAGGLTEADAARGPALGAHPGFRGVDVDSAARGDDGLLSAHRVAALDRAWTGPDRGAGSPLGIRVGAGPGTARSGTAGSRGPAPVRTAHPAWAPGPTGTPRRHPTTLRGNPT